MVINNEAGNSLNVVEREPVSTRVLNPKASENTINIFYSFLKKKILGQNLKKNFLTFFKFPWKIQNRLDKMKNQISDFSNF